MARVLNAARWLLFAILRWSLVVITWALRKLGKKRLLGLFMGGGVGAFLGLYTGVAFVGIAVVGSWFFAPLLGIIGVLLAPTLRFRTRGKPTTENMGNT